MFKTVAAIMAAALGATVFVALPGLWPQGTPPPAATSGSPEAPSRVAAAAPVSAACDKQAWPYIDASCSDSRPSVMRQIRVISTYQGAPQTLVTLAAKVDEPRVLVAAAPAPVVAPAPVAAAMPPQLQAAAPPQPAATPRRVSYRTVMPPKPTRVAHVNRALPFHAPRNIKPDETGYGRRGSALAYGEERRPFGGGFFAPFEGDSSIRW